MGDGIGEAYGLTETGGVAARGRILPGVDVLVDGEKVVDQALTGECWVHTLLLASGYVGDEATTAEQFVEKEGKRYFKTG